MPKVHFAGTDVECVHGANLRMVLVRARLPLYNSAARALNCRGLGTCGTCAVHVDGPVGPPTGRELRRLQLPPHRGDERLRLACQCTVLGDLRVTKYEGVFGQGDEALHEDG